MKKHAFMLMAAVALMLLTLLSGCGGQNDSEPSADTGLLSSTDAADNTSEEALSDEQALSAVKNYCLLSNPELESIIEDGEYVVYWEVESSDENEAVVLLRSYTGAQLRYYVNKLTGDAYVTEYMPGIYSDEEKTQESFNAKDYISGSDEQEKTPSLSGTWQTASVGYTDGDSVQPEYYVRFTDSEIIYGHMRDGKFVVDHTNKIVLLDETAEGGFRIQAETTDGFQYTYQTCESDIDVLEYFETWSEEDFSKMYRAGASLSRLE